MKRLATLIAAPILGWAQIEVYTVSASGVETPAPAIVELGSVPTGDILDTRFRLRNLGQATVTLQTLRISGPGFSLQGNPTGPQQMTPNDNIDFRVRFQPVSSGVHSAFLTVNDRMILIRGDSPGGVALSVDRDGGPQRVTNEQPVDFGRLDVGSVRIVRFLLRNEASGPATVSRIRLSGIFEGPLDIRLPLELGPGESATFGIRFAPSQPIVYHGSIDLDGRIYLIEGLAVEAPLPLADLLFGNTGSGQQATVAIRFKSTPVSRGTMVLKLSFTPGAGSQDDPAIRFLNGASAREISFNIIPNEFGREAMFQTGTTAGKIQFRLESAGRLLGETTVEIPPAPVRMTTVLVSRQPGSLQVNISGFDNTRSVSEATFTFYDKAGAPIGFDPLRTQVRDAFAAFFSNSKSGGVFRMLAEFPVTGDAAQLGGVQVEMINSAGPARAERVSF